MRNAYEEALILVTNHPLIALSLLIFGFIPWLNGVMHEARYFGECGIVGIRFFKHEVLAWREFLKRLRREVSSWE